MKEVMRGAMVESFVITIVVAMIEEVVTTERRDIVFGTHIEKIIEIMVGMIAEDIAHTVMKKYVVTSMVEIPMKRSGKDLENLGKTV